MATIETIAPHLSDYGIFSADTCDLTLRSRVIASLQQEPTQVGREQLADVVTYVGQLEDALLRYHWGDMRPREIHEILKCLTGLDIEARAGELAAMAAADA